MQERQAAIPSLEMLSEMKCSPPPVMSPSTLPSMTEQLLPKHRERGEGSEKLKNSAKIPDTVLILFKFHPLVYFACSFIKVSHTPTAFMFMMLYSVKISKSLGYPSSVFQGIYLLSYKKSLNMNPLR